MSALMGPGYWAGFPGQREPVRLTFGESKRSELGTLKMAGRYLTSMCEHSFLAETTPVTCRITESSQS